MKFVAARCPACGGQLQVPENLSVSKCSYCGSDVVLDHGGAKERKLPHLPKLARTAIDVGNYVEALDYYLQILELDTASVEAWVGRAQCTFALSECLDGKFEEAMTYLDHAQRVAPDDEEVRIKREQMTAAEATRSLELGCSEARASLIVIGRYPLRYLTGKLYREAVEIGPDGNFFHAETSPGSCQRAAFCYCARSFELTCDDNERLRAADIIVRINRIRPFILHPPLTDKVAYWEQELRQLQRRLNVPKHIPLLEEKQIALVTELGKTTGVFGASKRKRLLEEIAEIESQLQTYRSAAGLLSTGGAGPVDQGFSSFLKLFFGGSQAL